MNVATSTPACWPARSTGSSVPRESESASGRWACLTTSVQGRTVFARRLERLVRPPHFCIFQPNFLAILRTYLFCALRSLAGSSRSRRRGRSTVGASRTLTRTSSPTRTARSSHRTCSFVGEIRPAISSVNSSSRASRFPLPVFSPFRRTQSKQAVSTPWSPTPAVWSRPRISPKLPSLCSHITLV